jgi:F420-dependent oxidoreductase-like protein
MAPLARAERIGISIQGSSVSDLLAIIQEAEQAGVRQLWMTQGPSSFDAPTLYAAAFARTERIRLGTSIVPASPRHPLVFAQQALTLEGIAPGRFRLGIGSSHRPIMRATYGDDLPKPLGQIREYLTVLRAALWQGSVDFKGEFLEAHVASFPQAHVPILISALGEEAYKLAGELSDGGLAWNCPPSYLLERALPALQAGADTAGRPRPALVAHSWVMVGDDRAAARAALRPTIQGYARLPFYRNMFIQAGFPLESDGSVSDGLLDALLVAGNEEQVANRLAELLDSGFEELLLSSVAPNDGEQRGRLFKLVGSLG